MMQQVTLPVTPELWKRFKMKCAEDEVGMAEKVALLVKEYVEKKEDKK